MSTTATPAATFTLKDVGKDFTTKNITASASTKLKYTKDDLKLEFSFSDKTIKEASKLTGAGIVVDYKATKNVTLNGDLKLDSKVFKAGATWEDTFDGKKLQIKTAYGSEKKDLSTEVTATVDKSNKATVYLTNSEIISAKYVYTKDGLTVEPTFSVKSKKPAVSVSKKQNDHTYKISYSFEKETASVEWKYDIVKVTASSKLNNKGFSDKPSLAITLEKAFDL